MNEADNPKYTNAYNALEVGITTFSARNINLQRNAAKAANSLENKTINALEFGTRDGGTAKYFLEHYPLMKLKCIDIDSESLNVAKQSLSYTNRVKFENKDFLKYNKNHSEDNSYDLVFGVFVTHNFDDAIKISFLEKSFELLKKNGLLVLGDVMLYDHEDRNTAMWAKDYSMLEELSEEDKKWWKNHFDNYDNKYSRQSKWYLSQMTNNHEKSNFMSAKINYRDGFWTVITAEK